MSIRPRIEKNKKEPAEADSFCIWLRLLFFLLKGVLAEAADGALEVLGKILPRRTGGDAVVGITKRTKDRSLKDPDVIKLCGCSRNSYYKYKKELKNQ